MLMRLCAQTYAPWDNRYLSENFTGFKTQPTRLSVNLFVCLYEHVNDPKHFGALCLMVSWKLIYTQPQDVRSQLC